MISVFLNCLKSSATVYKKISGKKQWPFILMFAFIIAVMLQGTAEKETFKQLLFFKIGIYCRNCETKSTVVSFDLFNADVQSIKLLIPSGNFTAIRVQSSFIE